MRDVRPPRLDDDGADATSTPALATELEMRLNIAADSRCDRRPWIRGQHSWIELGVEGRLSEHARTLSS